MRCAVNIGTEISGNLAICFRKVAGFGQKRTESCATKLRELFCFTIQSNLKLIDWEALVKGLQTKPEQWYH